jgi:hypothetical protein
MDVVRILVGKIFDGHGHTVEDMLSPISDGYGISYLFAGDSRLSHRIILLKVVQDTSLATQ